MSRFFRIIYHCLFWSLSALFLTLFISKGSSGFGTVFSFVLLLMPIAILTTYSFTYFLIPRYLFQRKYFRFFLYSLFMVNLSIYLQMMVVLGSFIFLARYEFENMIPGTMNIINLGVGMYFVVFLSILIYLIKRWSRPENTGESYLTFRSNRETVRLNTDEILFIESLDNYVQVHSAEKVFITKMRISELEKELQDGFLRIHRSYLINMKKVESFSRENINLNGKRLPIGRKYKDQVTQTFGD